MRAMRFETFGDPSVLKLVEAPAADERPALVRVMAASINPSDVKNVAGAMKQTTLPRIPGRSPRPSDWAARKRPTARSRPAQRGGSCCGRRNEGPDDDRLPSHGPRCRDGLWSRSDPRLRR